MGKYNGAVITTAGQNLIAQAIAESKTVTFTTAQASSHVYPSSTDFEALTVLTDVEKTVDINYAGVYSDTVVQVSARFDNDGVETAYLINTLGFFAQLGTDTPILFAVSTAVTPDQMPVFDADNPSAFIYNVQITVQNADSISVSVNPAGTVTVDQLNQTVSALETNIENINMFTAGIQIPDNSNIDDYMTPGKYCVSTAASAQTMSGDVPFTASFRLNVVVEGTDWVHQYAHSAADPKIKHRVYRQNVTPAVWGYWSYVDDYYTTDRNIGKMIIGNMLNGSSGASTGDYILARNSSISGISDGLYKATKTIPANTAIDSTYLNAIYVGGLNDFKDSIFDQIKNAYLRFNTTLYGDILAIAQSIPNNSIYFYQASNQPTNRPSGCDWGSYLFIKFNLCTILYVDNAHIAHAYYIGTDSTSIPWHII